jgi:hypothetical protein
LIGTRYHSQSIALLPWLELWGYQKREKKSCELFSGILKIFPTNSSHPNDSKGQKDGSGTKQK